MTASGSDIPSPRDRLCLGVDKANRNLAKHEVSFETTTEAFFDPFLRVMDASDQGEVREAVIGMDHAERLLFVVHVEQEAERFRIISARKATAEERAYYEAQ